MGGEERKALEGVLGAALMVGAIEFKPHTWALGCVTMTVSSEMFTDKVFELTVSEDDWESGPNRTVAAELAGLIMCGGLKPIPAEERKT